MDVGATAKHFKYVAVWGISDHNRGRCNIFTTSFGISEKHLFLGSL